MHIIMDVILMGGEGERMMIGMDISLTFSEMDISTG